MAKTRIIKTTWDSRLYRILTKVVYRTTNAEKAKKSRFMYGLDGDVYFLRPLGILHGLFGLILELPNERGECE